MADQPHIEIFRQGAKAWRAWRDKSGGIVPDLQDADLVLSEPGLLAGFDLRGCDLSRAKFGKSNLAGTDLRHSILHDTDLSEVSGLQSWQVAGADLSGARLPGSLADLYKSLDGAKAISGNAQKLFVGVLAACLYSWLTIATTKDANLVTNRASSPLPLIQTSIPIVAFFIVTPLLLLGVFLYFHFYLQKLWEELGSLPAIFPDGRPLQTKSDPWLLSDLVRSHVKWLKGGRPFLSFLQEWISILVAWWVVPITLLLFWARYLPRHDWSGTGFHIALAGLSISAAVSLHRLAGETLRGADRQPFAWKRPSKASKSWRPIAVAIASAGVLAVLSFAAIAGAPSWFIPRAMIAMGYSPFANLGAADISVKPANWTGKTNSDLDPVQGLQLNRVDLRYADLLFAFLPKTVLTDSHLEGAELSFADLRQAELAGARLDGARLLYAHLDGADLVGATLSDVDLSGAVLDGADVSYVDFTGARLTPKQLASVQHKEEAIYDDVLLSELNLPNDNNVTQRQARRAYLAQIANSSSETVRILNSARRFGRSSEAVPLFLLVRTDASGRTQLTPATPPADGGGHPLTATELARLYNFPSEFDGSGQTIGIIELGGGYRMSDLNSYFVGLGLKTPDITAVLVNGAKNNPADGSGADGQVEMDLEVAGAIAPKAKIVVYFSKNSSTKEFLDAVRTAVSDKSHQLSVLLIDWGSAEDQMSQADMQALNATLQQGAQSGITIVAATGESGAAGGGTKAAVDFPTSSPWVMAVGGTKLVSNKDAIQSEVVWNDASAGGASGGGISAFFPLPDWQSGVNAPRRPDGKPGRVIPDVVANASPTTGFKLVIGGRPAVVGGTSGAAPLWAGLIALIDQGIGRRIGHINPYLYRVAGPRGAFRDIVSGNNSYNGVTGYSAGPGWDAASGWGSPDGRKLLDALKTAPPTAN